MKRSTVQRLRDLGFDESKRTGTGWRVRCSCCDVVTICGRPTHESGCPNDVRAHDGEVALLADDPRTGAA